MATVYESISDVTGLRVKKSSNPAKMILQYVKKVDALSDQEWGRLGQAAQNWHKAAAEAHNSKKPIPPMPGFPGEEAPEAAAAVEEEVPEGDSAEEGDKTKMAKNSVKRAAKANGPRKARAARAEAAPRRGRKGRFDLGSKITVLGENPRRPGSGAFERHAKLKSGMTVEEALAAGLSHSNLAKEVELKAIKIS